MGSPSVRGNHIIKINTIYHCKCKQICTTLWMVCKSLENNFCYHIGLHTCVQTSISINLCLIFVLGKQDRKDFGQLWMKTMQKTTFWYDLVQAALESRIRYSQCMHASTYVRMYVHHANKYICMYTMHLLMQFKIKSYFVCFKRKHKKWSKQS